MATNRIPKKSVELLNLAEHSADALHLHETAIGIKQNTEAAIRPDLAKAREASSAYRAALGENKVFAAALAEADDNAKAFIATSKSLLFCHLGSRWSPEWVTTGFPNNSLAVPTTTAARQSLLASLRDYFNANAAHQNEPLQITARRADELFMALKNAGSQLNDSNKAVTETKAALGEAEANLRIRMSGLVSELKQLIEDDDPRWYAFGLKRPADAEKPDIPDAPVLTPGVPGTVHVSWTATPRATRYRVYKKEAHDAGYLHAITAIDPEATVSGLEPAGTVQIQVSAANEAGESSPSDAAQITLPDAGAAAKGISASIS